MQKQTFYYSILILIIPLQFLFQSCSSKKDSTDKPNIILLLADDLGYGDLSCYGSVRQQTGKTDESDHPITIQVDHP